MEKVKTT
jgi:sugar phosphate permease